MMKIYSVSGIISNYEIIADDEQEAIEKFLDFVSNSSGPEHFEDIKVDYMGECEGGDDIDDAEYKDI
jgi:hypothetical protein